MRRLLQVELASETSGTLTLHPNTGRAIQSGDVKAWNKLASIVFAYHIADVVAQLDDVEIPSSCTISRAERPSKEKPLEIRLFFPLGTTSRQLWCMWKRPSGALFFN